MKQKQKDKIAQWMYDETRAFFEKNGKFPTANNVCIVIDAVYARIEAAEIWIPYDEIDSRYSSKRAKLCQRIQKEDIMRKHPSEKVIFMNMKEDRSIEEHLY